MLLWTCTFVLVKEAVPASGARLKHEGIIQMLNEKDIEISIMRQFITHEEHGAYHSQIEGQCRNDSF